MVVAAIVSLLAALAAAGSPASAQQLDDSQLERLRQMQQQQQQQRAAPTSQEVPSPVDEARPSAAEGEAAPRDRRQAPRQASRLERDFMERLERKAPEFAEPPLEQFGYAMLGQVSAPEGALSSGAINGDYRLGIGDEVVVTFRGQTNQSYRTEVDREGRVILPEMPPIPAAGRTFREFRKELEQRTQTTFLKTEVYVSLGKVRNFPVFVVGHVNNPGVHRLTGVASLLDALVSAGGIRKSGSLRRVQVIRGERTITIDLYDLLLTGRLRSELDIREGDRVFVPPLGPTVAVTGEVHRPGIYELAGAGASARVADVLELAGGTLRPSGYRYLRLAPQASGGDTVEDVPEVDEARLARGDLMIVAKSGYGWQGAFYLDGHVTAPGPRSLERYPTVGSIVRETDVVEENPYLLFAALETTDPETRARHFVPVDLAGIVTGQHDRDLRRGDRLILFSQGDVGFLSSTAVQAVIRGRGLEGERCAALEDLATVVARSRVERYAGARLETNPQTQPPAPESCPGVFNAHGGLLPFVLDYVALVLGEVRRPGVYPVVGRTALSALVPPAGGIAGDADLTNVEFTRYGEGGAATQRQRIDFTQASMAQLALAPGDVVRFSPKFSERDTGAVVLTGEFRRPGVYTIARGESLFDLIERAGGLTEQAYPFGAVFTRERVREQERESFVRAARELESNLATSLASGELQQQSDNLEAVVSSVRGVAQTLRETEPQGRVVVEADPTVLVAKPQLDTIMEPGDRIRMPKRPNHVTVSGEVLNPGTIQFRSGKTPADYIASAGGITRAADDGRTFVILPNGEAKPVAASYWNFEATQIPPGSTIVVPRDPKPFDLLAFSTSITDILSKLAITAASLAVIGR